MSRPYCKVLRACEKCGQPFMAYPRYIQQGKARFCGNSCSGKDKRRPLYNRFWDKVYKTDGCWIWTGALTHGYGEIRLSRVKRSTIFAHRLSWEIHFGVIPDGLDVLHNCPGGDNPAHLWLGTHAENMDDAVNKGQIARGEQHGHCKLSEEKVREARRRYAAGECTQRQLATEYGVTPSEISRAIGRKRCWKHVL